MAPKGGAMNTKTKVLHQAQNCILCRTCESVCPADAIKITPQDAMHVSFIIWQNSCTLCGNCAYFCPTAALSLEASASLINLQSEKYTAITHTKVAYVHCPTCKESMIRVPQTLLQKGFGEKHSEMALLFERCPKCRSIELFERRVL
jgi:formate hydrogenlyase subunit 6/NADH:ubiquinone oxidoreductase subunit I